MLFLVPVWIGQSRFEVEVGLAFEVLGVDGLGKFSKVWRLP